MAPGINTVEKCPWGRCPGTLELVSILSTDMGYARLDRNSKSEVFACTTCKRKFTRHWVWSQVGGEDLE